MRRKSTCRWKCLFYGNNDDGDDDGEVIYGDDQVVISMMMTKSCPGEQQSSCQLHRQSSPTSNWEQEDDQADSGKDIINRSSESSLNNLLEQAGENWETVEAYDIKYV